MNFSTKFRINISMNFKIALKVFTYNVDCFIKKLNYKYSLPLKGYVE